MFWLAGSLLIIGLASVVIPTIGWRWLIRIASIPGIVLIMAFKVRTLMGGLSGWPPRYLSHVHLAPLRKHLSQSAYEERVFGQHSRTSPVTKL